MPDLAEVFSIRVFSKYGSVSSDEIYGSIVVNDYDGKAVLFKRTAAPSDDSDSDSILPDGCLSLKPDRITRGGDWFIRLKLYQKKKGNNNYLQICNGFLRIGLIEECALYERPLICIFHGKDGHALVNLVMLTNAVVATVEVSLIHDDHHLGTSLYGHIRAGNSFVNTRNTNQKYFQITMLSASIDKPCYTNGSQIPLSRCMTPVPLRHELMIEAQLFHHPANTKMAIGNASFAACESGNQTQTIGCIQVKVTWSHASFYNC